MAVFSISLIFKIIKQFQCKGPNPTFYHKTSYELRVWALSLQVEYMDSKARRRQPRFQILNESYACICCATKLYTHCHSQ